MIELEKYGWVNALRGYAVLLVILIHSSGAFTLSYVATAVAHSGDMGVQLFFIMSSFTLFNSYSKRRYEADSKFVKRSFFIRRYFRIAPYYYVAGVIYTFFAIFFQHQDIKVFYLIANYLFINGIYLPAINYIPFGGWSVGTEMLFYLTIPFLFRYILTLKNAIIVLVISILISNLVNFALSNLIASYTHYNWIDLRGWTFYFWLPNQFPVFMYGIVLYFIYKFIQVEEKVGTLLLWLSICILILLSFFKFKLVYPNYFFQREYVYGFVFMLFAIGAYSSKNRFLFNKYIQNVGVVSFSMYLNHFLLVYGFHSLIHSVDDVFFNYLDFPKHILINNDFVFIITYAVIVYFTYLFSKITFKYIEARGIDLGKKCINKLNANKYLYEKP